MLDEGRKKYMYFMVFIINNEEKVIEKIRYWQLSENKIKIGNKKRSVFH